MKEKKALDFKRMLKTNRYSAAMLVDIKIKKSALVKNDDTTSNARYVQDYTKGEMKERCQTCPQRNVSSLDNSVNLE